MSENMMDEMEKEFELAMIEEDAVAHVQSMAIRLLRDKSISQRELAESMGVSPSHISQLLGDEPKNLSVRKAASLFFHLGEELQFSCDRIEEMNKQAVEKKNRNRSLFGVKSQASRWTEASNLNFQMKPKDLVAA